MLRLQTPSIFGDEIVLRSIDWLENFPWKQENSVRTENDKYVICLQVKDFSPEEIKVKTADGFIVVEAKHEEKRDEHGFISRELKRRYQLPKGCRLENVTSKLSPDGFLTIVIPRPALLNQDTLIPVSHEASKPKSKL
ncbi:hypothetical protein O3G_MSEX006665 [Manduca sexta]|uniref:SHSP domain-containing protein n=1 Tax=Manduca sexta TaxID=7130 RepID=A0A921Z5J8_MANSE|nr:hypothetical protein O3G_MSEX006665 [Manduca sexta]